MAGRKLLAMVALVAAVLVFAAPVQAQEFTLRIGTVAPEGTPWSELLKRIKKRVEKESGGRIKVKIYLGGQLGSEESLVRRVQQGTLEMVGVSTGAMAVAVEELHLLELPFLFENYRQVDHVLDTVLYEPMKEILAKKGFVLYEWAENGWRHWATKDRFLKAPGDFKGLKMRSQPSFVHVEMYNALGASPSPIAVPEVPSALQNGVVLGYDNSLLFAYAAQWYQGVRKLTISEHIYQPAVVVYNKAWFDKLPADLQALLTSNIAEDTKVGRDWVRKLNKPLVENYKKAGVEFYKLTPDERAALARVTRPVWDTFRKRVPQASRLLDQVLEAKKQVK